MPKLKPPVVNGVKFLTLSEAAEMLGYSTRWLYDLIYSGKVRANKRGNCWFINPREIDRLQATLSQTIEPVKKPVQRLSEEV